MGNKCITFFTHHQLFLSYFICRQFHWNLCHRLMNFRYDLWQELEPRADVWINNLKDLYKYFYKVFFHIGAGQHIIYQLLQIWPESTMEIFTRLRSITYPFTTALHIWLCISQGKTHINLLIHSIASAKRQVSYSQSFRHPSYFLLCRFIHQLEFQHSSSFI